MTERLFENWQLVGYCGFVFTKFLTEFEINLSLIHQHRSAKKDKAIRSFQVPALRFNAKQYFDMIDWSSCEPPITTDMSEEDLAAIVDNPESFRKDMKDFFCHTQPVERGVKMVTEASAIVANIEKRDGAIRAKILSRNNMPKFESKKHFNVPHNHWL